MSLLLQFSGTQRCGLRWLAALLCAGLCWHATARPPNILFILADNQGAEALSIYGNRDVHMPHIEALAARGIVFDKAFAASGMCSPTRATLMTGLMPSQHGLHNALHDDWVDSLEPGWSAVREFRTVPHTLAEHGYQTAMIGKWHIGDPKAPQLGYQHWVALPYGHTSSFWNNQLIDNGEMVDASGRHIVDIFADRAADYLAQVDRERPFYLQLNLDGPYALPPTNYGPARNRHYSRYSDQRFESMPREPSSDQVLKRLQGPFIAEHAIENGIEDMNLDEVWNSILYRTIRMQGHRESYANFLSQNTIVDDAVGRVWQALVDQGLADNTVVIYSADQGNLFGQHGTWGHTNWFWPAHLYDVAMRVPLIIAQPDAAQSGIRSNRLVGQYDIAPTLLSMAGIHDISLANSPGDVINASGESGPAAVFFEQEESRGLRTAQYAYWKRAPGMGEPELYDVLADPGQRNNLYLSLRESDIVAELDAMLEAFFARYSAPEYDLWQGGVTKGTAPNPGPWIDAYPVAWLIKFFRDYVSGPVIEEKFDYKTQSPHD